MTAILDLKPETRSPWQVFLAHPAAPVGLVMVSDMVFTTMDGFTQLVQLRGMPTGEVIFVRMCSNSILCLIHLLLYDRPALQALFNRSAINVWARALMASFATAGCYGAVTFVPLSVFMTTFHLRPFPTALACYVVLKERSSKIQIVAAVISFSAVILVVGPFEHRPIVGQGTALAVFIGVLMSFVSALSSAFDVVLCRQIGVEFGWLAMLFAYTTVGSLVGVGYSLITGTGFVPIRDPITLMMFTSISLSGFIAQMTMVLALQRASGMKFALLGYFQIVWAALWQATVRSDPPNLVQILGMGIIIVAGCWAILKGAPELEVQDKDAEAQISLIASPVTPMVGVRPDGYQPVPSVDVDFPSSLSEQENPVKD